MPPNEANYDEAKVPEYALPDPLILASGKPVADAATWTEIRRPEILQLFKTHIFGEMPGPLPATRFLITEEGEALGGRALRRQVRVCFTADNSGPSMDILLYRPADAAGPVPVFLGLNFFGNHSIQRDPAIHLNTRWMRAEEQNGIVNHRATFNSRGCLASRWPRRQDYRTRLRLGHYLLRRPRPPTTTTATKTASTRCSIKKDKNGLSPTSGVLSARGRGV